MLSEHPHRRLNPLTGEWVLVSPHRTERPWQGQTEIAAPGGQPTIRTVTSARGMRARAGPQSAVHLHLRLRQRFRRPEAGIPARDEHGLLMARSEPGICRVVCFSPRHNLTLSRMSVPDLRAVVDTWVAQYRELGGGAEFGYVQIFENRGAMMGASNPHPHCQIWATDRCPMRRRRKQWRRMPILPKITACMLCDYPAPSWQRGTGSVRQRALRGGRAFLGRLAVRDHSASASAVRWSSLS